MILRISLPRRTLLSSSTIPLQPVGCSSIASYRQQHRIEMSWSTMIVLLLVLGLGNVFRGIRRVIDRSTAISKARVLFVVTVNIL